MPGRPDPDNPVEACGSPGETRGPPGRHAPAVAGRCEIVGFGPIPADTMRRLLCNADVSRVITRGHSEILDVGMRHRLATPAQRRAVLVRSGGHCEIGECDIPFDHCDLHHIDPYNPRTGTGPTALANLVAPCPYHHHLLHEGGYSVRSTPAGLELRRPNGTLVTTTHTHRIPRG